MKINRATCRRFLVCIFLFPWFHVSCAADVTESNCVNVKQDVVKFTEEHIMPLAGIKNPPEIEQSMVEYVKRLRLEVRTCTPPDASDNTAEWNERDFIRLESRLAFFEITLGQAAAADNPETTQILINSPQFAKAIIDLQATLGITGGNGS